MHIDQLPPQSRIPRFFRRAELPLRQRNPHLPRNRPHRLWKRDRLHLHHERKHVPSLVAPKAVITRRPRIQIKRPRLLLVKRTQRRPVRPTLAQLHILAHYPDNIGLLLHGLRKTVGHSPSLKCRRPTRLLFFLCKLPKSTKSNIKILSWRTKLPPQQASEFGVLVNVPASGSRNEPAPSRPRRMTMNLPKKLLSLTIAAAIAVPVLTLSTPQAHAGIFISVGFAPPALPVYALPPIPGDGYIWTPGYWAYGDAGYYWVPGTWVLAPQPGYLWTPAYWGFEGGAYGFHEGYWGPPCRLLRRHQLWLRLRRHRLLRRRVARRSPLLQHRRHQLRWWIPHQQRLREPRSRRPQHHHQQQSLLL